MTSATEPLVFNPFDPGFRVDPYPVYRRFREEDPTHLSPFGFRVFSRYQDCAATLHHPDVSNDQRNGNVYQAFIAANPEWGERAERMEGRRPFLFLDPPDHTRLRGLVSKAFTPRTVERLRPRIQELADGLVGAMVERGEADVIEDLAYPLPVGIISEMLGVPPEDHETFKGWSRDLARSLDPDFGVPDEVVQQRLNAIEAFHEYFRGLIAARRASPADDLLTALIQAEERGDTLTEDEVLSTCTLLLVAGHETTVNLIANAVLALLRHPDQRQRLRAEPDLIRNAIEEALRYDPPVQLDARVFMGDAEVGGVEFHKGDQAMLMLAAANRDAQEFDQPDRFDIERPDVHHLSFGHGIHFCLGASLARLEGQIAVGTLVARAPALHLVTEDLEYKENIVLRGLAALPIALGGGG